MSKVGSTVRHMGFTHFSILRKAIASNASGMIHFRTVDDFSGVLLVKNGMIGDREEGMLTKFLSSPMLIVDWHKGDVQLELSPAAEAMTQAVNNLNWPDGQLRTISIMYSKLPPVHVRMIEAHFESFLTDISYNLFYQQATAIDGFTPAYFLLENDSSNSLLIHRVRVLTFNYVLGLMVSATKPAKIEKPKTFSASKGLFSTGVIKRIINRIRKIS